MNIGYHYSREVTMLSRLVRWWKVKRLEWAMRDLERFGDKADPSVRDALTQARQRLRELQM